MNLYTNNTFTGRWPVGSAAVVVADNAVEAAGALNAALRERGMPGDATAAQMELLLTDRQEVRILVDGEY